MPFPPPRKAYRPYRDLGKVASEDYQELQNVYFLKNPDLLEKKEVFVKKILGYTQQGTNTSTPAAKRGLAIGGFTPSVGSSGGVYCVWDRSSGTESDVYKLGSSDPTAQGVSAYLPTQDTDGEFEQVNDDFYYTNGADRVIKLTGSSGAWSQAASAEPLGGSNTVAKYISWHNFMLWAARTQTAPNKLNVSDAGDPETFSGNTKTFRTKIIGMKPLGEYQVIYTEKSIHLATGDDPALISFREVKNAHPCVSHRSIVVVPGDNGSLAHVYLGDKFVFITNGDQFKILGEDSWRKILPNLNTDRLDLAAAYYDTDTRQYVISVPSGTNTNNDTAFAYDFTSDKWIERPYWSAAAYTKHGSPTENTYFIESTAAGKAFLCNSGNNVEMPKTLLNGDHTASATSITADSTASYPSMGVIVIGTETISYASKTATTFDGCIRGYSGTTAATHSDNDPIYIANVFRYTTLDLHEGQPNLWKKYKRAWIDAKAQTNAYNVNIFTNIDRLGFSLQKSIGVQSAGATWGSFTWGDGTVWGSTKRVAYPDNRFSISGRGRTVKWKMEEYANVAQTEIYGIEYLMRILKIK